MNGNAFTVMNLLLQKKLMLPQYSVKCKHNVLKITLILQQSLSLGTLQKTAALAVCK